MSRIDKVFGQRGTPTFIGFTVGGDPDAEISFRIARALIDGGTDILEIGIPFSDPVADGPTIQRADDRARAAGITPTSIFALVKKIREYSEVPIVFLTYYNIVFRRGIERFYEDARDAGVDGILIADMPVEESGEVTGIAARYWNRSHLPDHKDHGGGEDRKDCRKSERISLPCLQCLASPVRDKYPEEALDLLRRVRTHTDLPLALGFGISTPDHARTCAAAGADGIIVGSAIVDIIEKNLTDPDAMEKQLRG